MLKSSNSPARSTVCHASPALQLETSRRGRCSISTFSAAPAPAGDAKRLIPLTETLLYVVSEGGRAWARDSERQAVGRGRTLAEFQKEFPDEPCCAAFLSSRRWPDGFVCPACGKRRAVALKSRPRLLECLDCGRQTSLTAGTAMHRSKLPLTTWFWAAHVMSTHFNGMSARQLEDQLGVTYKTAWLLAQKLRRAMVDPDRDLLEGVVEEDQTGDSLSRRRCFLRAQRRRQNPGRWRGRSDQSQRRQAQAEAQGREVSRHPLGPIAPVRDRRQLGQIDRDFRARQCEARRDTDHRRPSLLSGALGRLPTRSARCREHGGPSSCPGATAPSRC